MSEGDVESVERVIPAPPEKIFELLADPAKHCEIDGSGTVKRTKGDTERLKLGSKFGMHMKLGLPYSMESTVIEFEDGRRIAWQSRPPGIGGRFGGGRIWRYELEPVDGGTRARDLGHLRGGRHVEVARRARRLAQAHAREHGQDARVHRGDRQGVSRSGVLAGGRHHGDGRLAIWCAAPPGVQETLVGAEPDRFFRPAYVGHRGWLGLRLDRDLDWDEVEAVVEDAFRTVAPKTLVAQLDEG